MRYEVRLTDDATTDLEELYEYVARHDCVENADNLLSNLERTLASLAGSRTRGRCPPELETLGIREFREIHFKPYRILYRTIARRVFVYLIVDGRRDMQTLLQQRLLRVR